MICSLASRILSARQRQPVTTARLLRHRTAAYRATLQRCLFVPRMRPSAPFSSSPATNNAIQNA
jgi:hypothetical protein